MTPEASHGPDQDQELTRIVGEEEKVLTRVLSTIERRKAPARPSIDYEKELLALREQVQNARSEDLPPLLEEMDRVHALANARSQVVEGEVDTMTPYFGRLVLEQTAKKQEVLIGRSSFFDRTTGVRIVDWRDAPVSRIYYRCEEGDLYEENFGGREVEGEVLVRRAIGISGGKLKRIGAPQGTFVRKVDGWVRAGASMSKLAGGQGAALRPESHHAPSGKLGTGDVDPDRDDRSLSEITALIDPRQFELISKSTSGLVVIQGGAGSGKTTIGLHRLAFLTFQDKTRFRPDKMLVLVFNQALVRYISRVLPALGVEGVAVVTYEDWASKLRKLHVAYMPTDYADDTPSLVTRLKKHPVVLRLLRRHVARLTQNLENRMSVLFEKDSARALESVWRSTADEAPYKRLLVVREWAKNASLPADLHHGVEQVIKYGREVFADVAGIWAEVLTDKPLLEEAFRNEAPLAFSASELSFAHSHCARQIGEVVRVREARVEALRSGEKTEDADEKIVGIDGLDADEPPTLDREDDAILLAIHQMVKGRLMSKSEALAYEHIFVDETQDLSPLELSVIVDCASSARSITLAGDVAQKLHMDNGFTSWQEVLVDLQLEHVAIEPLKLSYRSTHEIIEFASDVLGHLRNEVSGEATRSGADVELFRFGSEGESVAFLTESLRELMTAEPKASVAIIARTPEQAARFYQGLEQGDLASIRHIADQDFPFKPGIDVTDIRQVKGLEFDYVVLVGVNTMSYPEDDESRHLLHIGATRAAHQLWVLSTGTPSMVIPEHLRMNA